MNTSIKKYLFPISCVVLVSCGGGGGDSSEKHESSAADQPYGEIVFSNQGNKLTASAWFFDARSADNAAAVPATSVWQANEEFCNRTGHDGNRFDAQLGKLWRQAYSAGDVVRVDSQAGNFATLNTQNLGSSVSYAMDARWIREPMPADAMLSIAGSDRFPSVPAIPITPLPLLNSVSPDTPAVTSANNIINWENNSTINSTIELIFSVSSATSEGDAVVCRVSDDGAFQAPAEVFNYLSENTTDAIPFSIVRFSENVTEIDNAILKITQLDHPL